MTSRRLVACIASLALVGVPLAGCGVEDEITEAESEGVYLDVGELRYQVQISRQLNPDDADDKTYLRDLPIGERTLKPGEAWFGVFMLVQNETNKPQRSAPFFEITDTQDRKFEPIELGEENDFAYRPAEVDPKNITPGQIPAKNSIAANNTSNGGALVLFKVPITAYDNRPLKLTIEQPLVEPEEAEVDLDV